MLARKSVPTAPEGTFFHPNHVHLILIKCVVLVTLRHMLLWGINLFLLPFFQTPNLNTHPSRPVALHGGGDVLKTSTH